MADPAAAIRAQAAALGFDACGIAPAGPSAHAGFAREWIAAGNHAGMAWLAASLEKRLDPALVLPGARSVVLVALGYLRPGVPAPAEIARYARGRDYHNVMLPRLRRLAAWMRTALACAARPYVDTGPLLERELAARTGVGWQGKSTMLVSTRLGKWFALGAILTDAALPQDPPHPDRCGRCSRCLVACPTGAITAPWRLDARRCLSFLTIENHGPIPGEFREALGARLFGCDDCLEACPWNRFAAVSREAAFDPRPVPPLQTLLLWDEAAFREHFRGSPVRRAGWNGLRRNAAVVLGNVGTPADLPALRQAAAGTHALVAEHAEWAVRRILDRAKTPPAGTERRF